MWRFGNTKPIKFWDVDVDRIVVSKLIKTKKNSKHLIGYLGDVEGPLVLILPKMSGYDQTFKDKNYESMSLRKDDDKLLEKV